MKFHLLITTIIVISLFHCACSDNENNIYNKPDAKLIPICIYNNYGMEYNYKYDDKDRITQIEMKDISLVSVYPPATTHTLYLIKYDDQNRIDSLIRVFKASYETAQYFPDDTVVYVYTGDEIRCNSKYFTEILETDTQGKILTGRFESIDKENDLYNGSSNIYEYDNNNNILSVNTIYADNIEDKYTYTYDKRNGVFKNVNMPQWFMVSQLSTEKQTVNNIISTMSEDIVYSITSYKYTENNYPRSYTIEPIGIYAEYAHSNSGFTYKIDYREAGFSNK